VGYRAIGQTNSVNARQRCAQRREKKLEKKTVDIHSGVLYRHFSLCTDEDGKAAVRPKLRNGKGKKILKKRNSRNTLRLDDP